MSQRDYNHVYTFGRLVLQIMQDSQHDGIAIDLIPEVTVAIKNNRCIFALGFNWLVGTINIGIMTAQYQQMEKQRQEKVKEQADKMNITPRQYALRWGW
jgi:hypothetical protein